MWNDAGRVSWFLAATTDGLVPAVPDQLVGPVAALVLSLVGLWLFITEKLVPGGRATRAEKAAADALLLAEEAIRSQKQMAAALEERNKLDQERLRLVQAGLIDDYRRGIRERDRSLE